MCNYICHEKCITTIMVDCIHLKAEKIVVSSIINDVIRRYIWVYQENVPHKWIGPEDKKKKKWCNICRKKITTPTWYCSGTYVCLRVIHMYVYVCVCVHVNM